MVVLGYNVVPVESLAETLQVAFAAGAKRLLILSSSVTAIPIVPVNYSISSKPAFILIPLMLCLRLWGGINATSFGTSSGK